MVIESKNSTESFDSTTFSSDPMSSDELIVDLDGFEGPLDLLLTLSRTQKLDLMKISILQLAEQYLEFVEKARSLQIEVAADYLVMAAWLAYLKSRLLLPPDPDRNEPTGEELAAHLAFQLERLQAMRDVAAKLMARDQLGRDFFARGIEEKVEKIRRIKYQASLLDLIQAYARIKTKDEFRPFVMDRDDVYTLEQALERMRGLIGYSIGWIDISNFLPDGWTSSASRIRAATASTFAATLELAKSGDLELRQSDNFGPIQFRSKGTDK
ncbi:segregation/condensation protein A [Paracoccaceae bacterium]|nr:segregation/condensation protein A [Paracoccaceae bacterium]